MQIFERQTFFLFAGNIGRSKKFPRVKKVKGTNLRIKINLSFAGFIEQEFIRPPVAVDVKSKEKNSIDCWVIWHYANCTQLVFSLSDVGKQTIPRYTRTVVRRADLNRHRGWSCHCVLVSRTQVFTVSRITPPLDYPKAGPLVVHQLQRAIEYHWEWKTEYNMCKISGNS